MKGRLAVTAAALLLSAARGTLAQVVPNAHWRTIRTEHFYVHYTPALEEAGRRAAVEAEQAYARLAGQLTPPRGPIDLVVADNVDYSNGSTTPFPTNRIVIYAHPPLDVPSLRFYDDWLALVITHELTHAFHLDRAGGWWRVAQHVFGRAPFFMPALYAPGWVIEGLATYYESELTGAGRVAGTYERMMLNASVLGGGLPRIDQWNLTTSLYPGGELAYGFGALFFDYLAQTRGEQRVADFVSRASRAPLPFTLDHVAARSFGISFSSAWQEWRESLSATADGIEEPLPGWRELTSGGHLASYPRWADSASLVFMGNTWKDVPSAYRVDLAGRVTRLGRRNGSDVNVPFPNGSILFAQLDFTDPYHVRSDLYVQRGSRQWRLTHGARLAEPDVRADGAIIAVRSAPGTTQLVRVSANGARVTDLTTPSLDEEWAEPRWSPRGDRIVATRWTRGGYADIVVLDTLGAVLSQITHDRAFDSSPSWSPDGRSVLFTSDRTGIAEVYIAPANGSAAPKRLSRAATGLFYPTLSPSGRELAAVSYDDRGWHVGVAPFDTTNADSPPVDSMFEASPLPPAGRDSSRSRPYSPWRGLVPRYWLPLIGQTTTGGYSFGALTSGADVIGLHSYSAQVLFDPEHDEHAFDASYRYAGLGQPLLGSTLSQYWDRYSVVDTAGQKVGELQRRTRLLSLGATVTRPRARSSAFASLSAELEQRDYATDPAPLIGRLTNYYRSGPLFYGLLASAGWSNARRPVLSISPEDGITLRTTGRLRWRDETGAVESRSLSGVLNAYKSIDAGGYAHHVLAAHVAAGVASGVDPGEFEIGGTAGASLSVLPGVIVAGYRTFGVRGFPIGARSGTHALVGSLEYRAPLAAPHRGLGMLPLFLDRASVSLFADAGSAWGPRALGRFSTSWIASAGAELNLDTAIQYDVPYRLRVGLAVPVVDHSFNGARPLSVYVSLGLAF